MIAVHTDDKVYLSTYSALNSSNMIALVAVIKQIQGKNPQKVD